MQLFVWHGVLTDCTSGMMFAIAQNVDRARELLRGELLHGVMSQYDEDEADIAKEPSEIREVSQEYCDYVYGGG